MQDSKPAVRTIKIQGRSIIPGKRSHNEQHYPELRLTGRWLERCGFKEGQHVEIIQERHKLIITPAWFEEVEDGDIMLSKK